MRMSEGVEWAAHACALLAALPPDRSLSGSALAGFHELPRPYMAKHLQALARAGLLHVTRGSQGGYRLARPAQEISLWDIRMAICASERMFECQNIRLRGPCADYSPASLPCEVAAAFWDAERVYRAKLESVTIAGIARAVAAKLGKEGRSRLHEWVEKYGGGRT